MSVEWKGQLIAAGLKLLVLIAQQNSIQYLTGYGRSFFSFIRYPFALFIKILVLEISIQIVISNKTTSNIRALALPL